jgi:ribosome biogenesis GTPase
LEKRLNNNLNTYRICGEEKGSFSVLSSQGEILHAEVKGKLRLEGLWPSVGDWVLGSEQPGDWFVIEKVTDRKNVLQRKEVGGPGPQVFAANVDFMFVVTSANFDLSLNRMDRYMAMAYACGIQPIILVNKVDLVENPVEIIDRLAERFPNVNIHGVSAQENLNLEIFDSYLQAGTAAVFVGSSGVGKSSLSNALIGTKVLDVKAIREEDSRGRHTTTSRSLHLLKNGAAIIDTPGIRVLGLTEAADGVDEVFADILDLATKCRFNDCQHQSEPGCQILQALDKEQLDPDRWQNFLKLRRETDFQERKSDKSLQREAKRKIVQRQKEYKKIKSEKARR